MKQPGDVLASAMEYMPGKGVYEDNGELIAGVCGTVKEDTENMIISIKPSVSTPVKFKEGDKIFSEEHGNVGGAEGLAVVPKGQEEAVVESAEECPGECIMIEP